MLRASWGHARVAPGTPHPTQDNQKQKIKDKIVHILCHIPNNNLFVEAKAKTFEEATDEAVEDLKRQIKRKKEIALAKASSGSSEAIQDRDWEDYDD